MKFSLILATIDRTSEVRRFVDSLLKQSHLDVQLIVADGNADDRLVTLLPESTDRLEVIHVRPPPGLSRARNSGLARATGDVVAFPDDDCWYGPEVLAQASRFLRDRPEVDVVTGRTIDAEGRESSGHFAKKGGPVSMIDVWSKGVSCAIFMRREICERVGFFDETLGIGSGTPFGAGDETDYLIRALQSKARIEYAPTLTVFHPNKGLEFEPDMLERARRYGAGWGRVLVKHNYPLWFRVRSLYRPFLGSVKAACTGQWGLSKVRWNTFVGRYQGLVSDEPLT